MTFSPRSVPRVLFRFAAKNHCTSLSPTMQTFVEQMKTVLHVRPSSCRECGNDVGALTDICPRCGAKSPVRLPRWFGIAAAVLVIQQIILIMH